MIVFDSIYKFYYRDIFRTKEYAILKILWGSRKPPRKKERGFYALRDVSFSVKKGEKLLVLGHAKSGKTTIAKLICGLVQPSYGSLKVNGKVRLVTQSDIASSPFMTLKQYAILLSLIFGVKTSDIEGITARIFEELGIKDFVNVRVYDAPKEIIKKLAYYLSIIIDADIYVFDETLDIHDPEFKEICKRRIEEIFNNSTVIILSSTLRNMPENLDKAVILNNGSVSYQGHYKFAKQLYLKLLANPLLTKEDENPSSILESMYHKYMKAKKTTQDIQHKPRAYIEIYAEKIINDKIIKLKGKKLIVIGPYLSDTGIELLYWIPFLRWLIENNNLDPDCLLAISRYGADLFYETLCVRYVDAFDLMSSDEFTSIQKERISLERGMKQNSFTEPEKKFLKRAEKKLNIENYEVLHPSLMYRLFKFAWKHILPENFIENYTVYRPLKTSIDDGVTSFLPKDYIAINFSFSPCFPDTLQNRNFLEELLHMITKNFSVVVLNNGWKIDAHKDFISVLEENLYGIDELVSCRNYLTIQTKVISNARLFVGMPSGISYIAPFLNKETFYLYSRDDEGIYLVNFQLLRSQRMGFSVIPSFLNISDCKPSDIMNEIEKIFQMK